MICSYCKHDDNEHIIIVKYYGDYGNQFEYSETYCGYGCLRKAIE